jgi:bifunctional DNA-binding transcriptional regulator/antitoxin component of YhaV-PrlF toxin-antitoxin module
MQTSYTATVTSKGQLTLPSAFRHASKIKPGHKIIISAHPTKKHHYTLAVSQKVPRISLDQAFGALYRPGMKYVPIEVAREIAGKELGKKYALTRR